MQIKLKQPEIVEALKQYITKQGINLSGKVVDVGFTAGRNDAGLSADIGIDDADIPGLFNDTPQDAARPALSVVAATPTDAVAPVVEQQLVDVKAEVGKSLFS